MSIVECPVGLLSSVSDAGVRCDCGAAKTYKVGPGAIGHSDWCSASAKSIAAGLQHPVFTGESILPPGKITVISSAAHPTLAVPVAAGGRATCDTAGCMNFSIFLLEDTATKTSQHACWTHACVTGKTVRWDPTGPVRQCYHASMCKNPVEWIRVSPGMAVREYYCATHINTVTAGQFVPISP